MMYEYVCPLIDFEGVCNLFSKRLPPNSYRRLREAGSVPSASERLLGNGADGEGWGMRLGIELTTSEIETPGRYWERWRVRLS